MNAPLPRLRRGLSVLHLVLHRARGLGARRGTLGGAASRRDHRGLAALLLGSALLGFGAIFVKWASAASAEVIGFYRMAFALPAVLLLVWAEPRGAGSGSGAAPHAGGGVDWAGLAGLCFTTDVFIWHLSLRHTSAANATLLTCLAPLWVVLTAAVFLGQRLRAGVWLGLGLALTGAATLALARGAQVGTGRGEALALTSSLFYGGYAFCLGRARRSLSARRALATVVLVCFLSYGAMGFVMGRAFLGFPPAAWLALLGLGLFQQVLAWWLITWGLGRLPEGQGSIGLLMQPVGTVALGWLLLGEAVRPVQAMGMLSTLGGIALALRPRRA